MDRFKYLEDGMKIILPREDIHIFDEDTVKAEYAFSNNDASEKHIWCRMKNKKDITIDGGGALLMFHDRITPFILDNCEKICLRNFTIDYQRPFFTQGKILYADMHCVELDIPQEYPYRVEGKNLIMESETWENNLRDGIMLFQEFAPHTGSLAYNSPVLIYRVGENAQIDPTAPLPMRILTAEKTERGTLRLRGEFPWKYTVGNVLVMTHERRCNPGIGIHNCRDICLENIHIIHTGSMGIVAQLSRDLSFKRIRVALGNRPERLISTNCDAVHLAACSGNVEITDCCFEHMMDDGVNVHGVYTLLENVCGTGAVETKIMHFQQYGVNFYREGDKVAIYCGHTTQLRGYRTVRSSRLISQDRIYLEFFESDDSFCPGDFIENLTATPNLHIKGLRTGFNRPRGILPTTPRKVLIEDCVFYNSGYGIHIAGDTRFWYESGSVEDVVIRNNRFVNCGHNTGDFSIAITPEYERTDTSLFFHRNIVIQNNQFESFVDGILYAYGVCGLVVEGNVLRKNTIYQKRINTLPVVLRGCAEVVSDTQVRWVHESMES